MVKDPKIFTYFDCSTGHMSANDADLLQNTWHCEENGISTVHWYAEGFWVHIPTDDEFWDENNEFSEGFMQVMRAAKEAGCYFVRFDRDGSVYPEFTTYDW